MAGEQFEEKAIFNVARQIDAPDARREYLGQVCGADADLMQRVEDLLRGYEAQASFLESPPVGNIPPTIDHSPVEQPGKQIGPYKLIEQIGEGGMGTVWMAQQSEPVRRLVAVKLIKLGLDSREVIARFEAERQALALMDHPNIAKVLDAGTAGDSGRPYVVMELVKGVPITRYCDEHHLTPRQRLELFMPVCQAIQHAHQKGIIHRDIKPSNVLVALFDDKPVPKIIDFGVAKATGQQLTEMTLNTGFGTVVGTLEYMSPEQAGFNQLDIDTRSDIYSLGVLLYELLSGSPPFQRRDLEQAGLLEMLRVIREQEPSKPSTKLSSSAALPSISANRGTEPSRLTKLLRGELDWIVMKALEKDRSRRYETANGFAADVQRFLSDETVQACPPSAGYRLRKFLRRNKSGVAVGALVLFFLVLLGSGVGWALRDRAARRAEASKELAERQSKVATQVELVFAEADRLMKEQKWDAALAVTKRAEAAISGGEADAETFQRVRARLNNLAFIERLDQIRMHRATIDQGKFNNADAAREYARAFRDYGVDIEEMETEAAIHQLKARSELAIPLATALDDWVYARRRISNSDTAGWMRLVAVARGIDPEPLRDWLRSTWERPVSEVRDELRRLAESIEVRAQPPATVVMLGESLWRVNQSDSAIRVLRRAQRAFPGEFWLNDKLAFLLYRQNDHEGAIRFYAAALSLRPNSVLANNNLGLALAGSANQFIRQNADRTKSQLILEEAVACFNKAIDLEAKFTPAYNNLGAVYCDYLHDYGKAIECFRKVIELDPLNVLAHYNLGNALQANQKLDEAIAAYRKAIEIDPKYSAAYFNLGNALYYQKNLDEAIDAYRKPIELDSTYTAAAAGAFVLVAKEYLNLDYAKRDPGRAVSLAKEAVEWAPDVGNYWNTLGVAQYRSGDWNAAIVTFEKSMELRQGGDSLDWFFLAMANWRLGEKEKAREFYERAVQWMEANKKENAELIRVRSEAQEVMSK